MNISEFILKHDLQKKISCKYSQSGSNPGVFLPPGFNVVHWKVLMEIRLKAETKLIRKEMTCTVTMSKKKIQAPPTLACVLSALLVDCKSIEASHDFRSWLEGSNLPFDLNVETNEKIYKVVLRNAEKCKGLLGSFWEDFLLCQ